MSDYDARKILANLNACDEARSWLRSYARASDAWRECTRGDWLLWIAARAGVDRRLIVRAACDCARLVLHLVPADELRSLRAIETAERWCDGLATLTEVRTAAAYDAANNAAAAYADAAAAYAYADADAARTRMQRRCADAVRARITLDDVRAALMPRLAQWPEAAL